jgi:hypothetical protein
VVVLDEEIKDPTRLEPLGKAKDSKIFSSLQKK